jgi:hypothetical protein
VRPASPLSPAKLAERPAVRNPSAVVPADANARQRRQPLDLLIPKALNALNTNKRPVRLVRIEKVRGSIAHAQLGVAHTLAQLRAAVPAAVGRQSSLEVGRFPDGVPKPLRGTESRPTR